MINTDMPRKTLALITCLVIVTVILFVIAIRTGNKSMAPQPEQPMTQPSPTSVAHSVLTISPNPLSVVSGQQGTAEVILDASDNAVTAVQLEIAYDPNLLSNVKVTPGAAFTNPVVLIDKNNIQGGRFTYAVGISPSSTPIQGKVTAATITFTAKTAPNGQQTQLALLPTTLVTARGVASSVLKQATGTLVIFGSAGAANTTTNTGAMSPSGATQY